LDRIELCGYSGDMSRRARLLDTLADHPEGLAAEVLLGMVCQPPERQLMLRQLRLLAADGLITVSGKKAPYEIASALVQRTALAKPLRSRAAPGSAGTTYAGNSKSP
jgi:hypothetical protein